MGTFLRAALRGRAVTVCDRDTPIAAVIAYLDASVALRLVLGEAQRLATAARAMGPEVIGA